MIDEKGIRERLRELYGGPGWTVYEELERGAACGGINGLGTRRIDFFAHYRKQHNHQRFVAIEIKTNRMDLACELRHPAKRAVWEGVVDECHFACPHGIVRPDEIPDPWGLITFKGDMVIHAKQHVWQRGYPDRALAFNLGMRIGRNDTSGKVTTKLSVDIDGGVHKAFIAHIKSQNTSNRSEVTEALAEYLDRRNIPYHRSIPLDLSA